MRPDVILFDLDGTLTESGPGITRSIAFALDAVGMPALDSADLLRFIGPPLADSFREIAALDDETAQAALLEFARYFAEHGMFENSVYPGVADLLQSLTDDGRKLAVATSKPTPAAVAVLDHFALREHFDAVCGAIGDGEHATKAEVVADALVALGTTAGPHVTLVGDRSHDVIGARAVGIGCIGVAWGYGSRDELLEAGANTVVADVDELASLLGVRV